jgi:hypothetical protein
MSHLPDIRIGWEAYDPGPPPRSPLLNDPPVEGQADLIAAHEAWRRRVEHDEAKLAAAHRNQPVWYPLLSPATHPLLPVFGGTPRSWDSLLAAFMVAGIDSGFERIQVLNLMEWTVLDSMERVAKGARRNGVSFETVSSNGSTLDLFGQGDVKELVSYVVDVLRIVGDRQGRRDAARAQADLLQVATQLTSPINVDRLCAALDVALGSMSPPAIGTLSSAEERTLRDFYHVVVSRRSETAGRLDVLLADLRELARYQQSPACTPRRYGTATVVCRAYESDRSQGIQEFETGRELLARALARSFAHSANKLELLAVAGADKLAPEVLSSLRGSAQQMNKQLVLMFSELTDEAKRTFGSGGTDFAMFLRLPNPDDAEFAAKYFGREFTFVVSGTSIAEGRTKEWNDTFGRSSGSGTTRTHTWGHLFGSTIARSFNEEETSTHGTGGGTSRTATLNTARVHEYVIQPEQFQQLDDLAMLVADGKRATLASCDYRLHRGSQTSPLPLALSGP